MNHYSFSALLLGTIVIAILLQYGFKTQRNNLMLAASLACLCFSILFTWLISSEVIRQYPAFIRMGNIFGYLVFPLLYVFVRNTFYPGRFWQKTDFLFLIPTIIYIVDLMPFYLLPAGEKIDIMYSNYQDGREVFRHREGWIFPPWTHFYFRVVWCLVIHVFVMFLIYRNWRYDQPNPSANNRSVFRFVVALTAQFIPLTLIMVLGTFSQATWWKMSFFNILLSLPMLGTGIFLLFSPGFIYGFRKLTYEPRTPGAGLGRLLDMRATEEPVEVAPLAAPETVTDKEEETSARVAAEVVDRYQLQLLHFMDSEKPYLQKGLTIHLLSQQCGIPVYVISAIINNGLNSNFNSWINRYRVFQFIEFSQSPGYEHYTAEALATEAGFSGRATFHTAFKREMGMTPGQYLKTRVSVAM